MLLSNYKAFCSSIILTITNKQNKLNITPQYAIYKIQVFQNMNLRNMSTATSYKYYVYINSEPTPADLETCNHSR
ncbi:MAG: hypothetical protein O7D30_07245 [Rickettsia endosymbiont of Ixodes persulcatus]|nr:hypothetical protein [Rickettsia endosymbiont of Ixodes persulcatus]